MLVLILCCKVLFFLLSLRFFFSSVLPLSFVILSVFYLQYFERSRFFFTFTRLSLFTLRAFLFITEFLFISDNINCSSTKVAREKNKVLCLYQLFEYAGKKKCWIEFLLSAMKSVFLEVYFPLQRLTIKCFIGSKENQGFKGSSFCSTLQFTNVSINLITLSDLFSFFGSKNDVKREYDIPLVTIVYTKATSLLSRFIYTWLYNIRGYTLSTAKKNYNILVWVIFHLHFFCIFIKTFAFCYRLIYKKRKSTASSFYFINSVIIKLIMEKSVSHWN